MKIKEKFKSKLLVEGNDDQHVIWTLCEHHVDSTLLDIEQNNISKYKSRHKAKARIHTFLAWQEDPGTPMGLAITKKYLDPKAPSSQLFVNWLNALYTQD